MSLDVYLTNPYSGEEVYSSNITHNLNAMAEAAGIYDIVWRPEESGIEKASQVTERLLAGINSLLQDPEKYMKLEPSNKWGTYVQFIPWLINYYLACKLNPDAVVKVSR